MYKVNDCDGWMDDGVALCDVLFSSSARSASFCWIEVQGKD